jgi:predicted DNA-binding transcriptional regulator YafY
VDKLLTKKDLAEHWQVSVATIDKYIADGIITPIYSIPSIRFNPQYIAQLDGTKLDKFSPIERRKLEKELEEWKVRAEKAEGTLAKVNADITEVLYQKIKETRRYANE